MHKFENCLVVGISSRALFDLEEENKIFEEQGVAAYAEYQIKNETNILKMKRRMRRPHCQKALLQSC